MLKKVIRAAAFFILLFVSGCLVSLHPISTNKELVSDRKLDGIWSDEETQRSFTAIRNGKYKLYYTSKEGDATLVVHLVRLKGRLFFDIFPDTNGVLDKASEWKISDYYLIHLFPVHTIVRIDQLAPTSRMSVISPE